MTLPKAVLDFLNSKAKLARIAQLKADDNLFDMGVLDSFMVVDLVSILEEECNIKILDADVTAENFQSINAIERYVQSRKV